MSTNSSDVLLDVWAKSPDEPGLRAGETLAAHTGNVVERLARWRDRSPKLPELCLRPNLWDLVAWACLLHDVGKVASGFQAMLRGGERFAHRHEVLSLVAVGWLDISDSDLEVVATGVATHHRDIEANERTIFGLYGIATGNRERILEQMDADCEHRVRSWLNGAGRPRIERLGFAALPALRNISKVASMDRAFKTLARLQARLKEQDADSPENLAATFARGLVLLADHAGSAHVRLRASDRLATRDRVRDHLRDTKGQPIQLLPHQRAVSEVVGHAVLRAPTGSGKTEAALLWAARQYEQGEGREPLFYVLPYKASMNAMHDRLVNRNGFRDDEVALQHSSALTAIYSGLVTAKGYTGVAASREARRSNALGRLMATPVRVLSPYQILKAFFGVRGHEATLSDAARGVFVLDELHAYDVDRLGLILASFGFIAKTLNARILAMSATFPRLLEEVWREAVGDAVPVRASDEVFRAFQRHRLLVREADLMDSVSEIADRARFGEAVLVVATTVARAQAIYDRLKELLGPEDVFPIHSRFTAADRSSKERLLASRAGTGIDRRGGLVCVGTQVVEVSLDVDFDVLFSDPAPVEALLQRFGRVNRGRRGGLRDVVVFAVEPSGSRWVYDTKLVMGALRILRPEHGVAVDEGRAQEWVDAAYAPVADAWRSAVRSSINRYTRDVIRVNRPLVTADGIEEIFDDLFDGCEVVPESLSGLYVALLADAPLESAELRVPILSGQLARLFREGRVEKRVVDRVSFLVVKVPYDSERGLNLAAKQAIETALPAEKDSD